MAGGDDKFLELAVNGKATHLISGDPDLLTLHPFHGIEIVEPWQTLVLPIMGPRSQSQQESAQVAVESRGSSACFLFGAPHLAICS